MCLKEKIAVNSLPCPKNSQLLSYKLVNKRGPLPPFVLSWGRTSHIFIYQVNESLYYSQEDTVEGWVVFFSIEIFVKIHL